VFQVSPITLPAVSTNSEIFQKEHVAATVQTATSKILMRLSMA